MEKMAEGQNGIVLGTEAYFAALNRGTVLEAFLSHSGSHDWQSGLEALAKQAMDTLAQICSDLKEHEGILRYIPHERRGSSVAAATVGWTAFLAPLLCGRLCSGARPSPWERMTPSGFSSRS